MLPTPIILNTNKKPMVTNECLEILLGAFQVKIVKRFEEELDEKNAKTIELQSEIAMQD